MGTTHFIIQYQMPDLETKQIAVDYFLFKNIKSDINLTNKAILHCESNKSLPVPKLHIIN